MDWCNHFNDDFRGAVVDSLLEAEPSRILSGFSSDDAIGPLSKALISVISESIGELWATQAGDGMSPLRVSDALDSLGLSNRNLPFARELQDALDTQRDRLVVNENTLHSLIDRARKRRSRDTLPEHQFAKRGMWAIRFAGKETFLEGDLKGAAFIHHLIRHQGMQIHVIRLMADVAGAERTKIVPAAEGLETDSAAADDAADKRTIKECEARYDSLVAEREYANEDRVSEIETEISKIAAYFSSTLGLGKKSRKMGDEVAAARRRIARVINIAFDKIDKSDVELATHLRNSIRTHTEMVYEPDREVDWVLT